MASSGSVNRKSHVSTSGRFSWRDVGRDVVRGARSMERLNSVEGERSPRLIFSTGQGSFVRQRQEELLRSASMSGSQPHLDSLNTFRTSNNPPNASTINTTTNNTSNNTEDNKVTLHNGLRRSSSQRLPRIPSKTLRDLDLLRLNRRSDIIRRGIGGAEEGQPERERKTERLSCDDPQHSSSSSSSPPSKIPNSGMDIPRRHVSENCDEVVMRRKTSNNKSPKQQTSEQTSSDHASLSRPSSLHSERNSSRTFSWGGNPSAKNARLSLSSSSKSSTSRPNSVNMDKDSSLDSSRRSSAGVERSSSLRDRSRSSFSERYAFWSRPTRSSFRSERTISLTNLSTATHTENQDRADTKRVVNHSSTSGDRSPRTDSDVQGNVQSKAATSFSRQRRIPSFPKGTDNNSVSEPDRSVSFPAGHSTPLSSSRADVQSIVNYDGSGLEVVQSVPPSVSPSTVGEQHSRSSEMKTVSAVTEKTKRRTKKHSASPAREEKADKKGGVRNTLTKASSKAVTLNKVDVTDQMLTAASIPRSSSPSDNSSSLSSTLEFTPISKGTPSENAPLGFPDPDREWEDPKNSTSADAVLSYLDDTLESHSTKPVSPSPPSVSSHQPTHHQHQPAESQNSENQKRSVSMAKTIDNTSHSVSDHTVMNGLSGKPPKPETSTGKVTFRDQTVTGLPIQEKKKGGKAQRKTTPTKVTKYEGSVKTVRRQIKPGHVEGLREMFKKQEEEQDKLVMRHRKRRPRSHEVDGSTEDADDSGSGYSTTSSDNEYDLELAEKLNSSDFFIETLLSPPVPSSQCEVQQQEDTTEVSRIANRTSPLVKNEECRQLKESFQVENVSDSISSDVGEKRDKTRDGRGKKVKDNNSVPSSGEAQSPHSPEVSPTGEPTCVGTAQPQPSSSSVDLTAHTPRTTESKLYTGTTALSILNTAAVETGFSTSQNDEAIQQHKGMNSVDAPGILFERMDNVSHLQTRTGDESHTFQNVTLTTNLRDRDGSNPPRTRSKKRSVLHQVTPDVGQTHHVMDDCHRGHQTSPPPEITAGRGEEEPVMNASDGKGGGLELTDKVDSDGLSTIFWSSDRHHDDTNSARGEVGGRRESPQSLAEKDINPNSVSPTISRLQVFESRNKNLGEEGGENLTVNHSVLFTSRQTPPLAVPSQQTRPTDHVSNLPIQSHSSPSPDTHGQEETGDTPTDFLSLLDNIHLDSKPSFNAKTAQRARQLYFKDSVDEKRISTEIPSSEVNGFELENARERSSGLSLNEAEDSDAQKGDANLLATASVTLFTNDTFTLSTEPTRNESAANNVQGVSQQENKKSEKDGDEVCKPDEPWMSSLPSLVLQDRQEKAAEMSTSSDTKQDTSMSKDDTNTSEDNTNKAMELSTASVTDISAVSIENVTSDSATLNSKPLNSNSNGNTAEVSPLIATQTSEVSHALVTDNSETGPVPKDEVLGEESVTSPRADKDEPPQTSRDRAFEIGVVAGNIGVKLNPQPPAATPEISAREEDEHMQFLNPENDHGQPSKTSSQVLPQSPLDPSASHSTLKERYRKQVPSKRRGKPIIMSIKAGNGQPDREVTLPRQHVSQSRVNLRKDRNATAASVVPVTNKVDRLPSKVATFSSHHTATTDTIWEPVSGHKILDRNMELQTGSSHPDHETTATFDTSAGISVQDDIRDKMNENHTSQPVQNSSHEASRTSSSGSHQILSSILINHDPSRTQEYRASHFSSSGELAGKIRSEMSDEPTKERDGKENDVSPRVLHTEEKKHNTNRSGHLEMSLHDSNDRKKSSSRVLVLNTSLHHNTSQDTTSLNSNNNTSFGDNDSQYGSQTSKATSVGDISPTDEHLYRITHTDTSITSSTLPVNPPPPPQQHVVFSSVDRETRAKVERQNESLNRLQDDIFSQHDSVNASNVWRTGRLSVSDPDLSQSLFGRSLSTHKATPTEKRTQNEAGHGVDRLRSSPSESDEDSGVEGGKRYKSETKLDIGSTEKTDSFTGSLSNIHLSLRPPSPTSSANSYRVSSVKRQTSWEKTQEEDARDQSRNVYRVSQIRTAKDEPKKREEKSGHGALKRQSWSSPTRPEENNVQAFKVLHTLPAQKSSLMDDGNFRGSQMTSQQNTPPTASLSFDDSRSNRPPPVSPSHKTSSPADVKQQRSVISPDVSSDTSTTAAHRIEPQYLVTILKPAGHSETQKAVDRDSRERTDGVKLKEPTEPVRVSSSRQDHPRRSQDVQSSFTAASAQRRSPPDDGSDMDRNPNYKTYHVSTTANLQHRPDSSHYDNVPDYDESPDYDNLPAVSDSKRYVVHGSSQPSAANTTPSLGPSFLEEKTLTLRELAPTVSSPPPEPRPLFHDTAWQPRPTNSNDVIIVQKDAYTLSPHHQQQQQQQQQSRNHSAFSVDNVQDNARDVSHVPPSRQQYSSQNVWSSEQPWRIGSLSPDTPTRSAFHDVHTGQHHYPPAQPHSEYLHHRPPGRDVHTTSSTNDADADDDPGAFRREVYEESRYEICQDTTTPVLPESAASEEEKDLRVLHGKILIQNRLDDSRAEEDFLHNMNIFDTSFHMDKDNPLYQSDPDIYKALEVELQQQEEQRRTQAIGQEVTQDVTWETVERVARRHKEDPSPTPHRPKQNLSTLLLSKLSSIHSQDIHQHIDVTHHHEDIFGDLHLMHADGSRAASSHTSNFDSVHENIELLLKEGKAFVIIKVIAERIVPVDPEFDAWRKSQAIVTRNIEIDLHATDQRRRLYQNVMNSGGRVPGAWQDVADGSALDEAVGESWPGGDGGGRGGGGFVEGSGGATLRSSGGEFEERQLSSLETLRLFSQILGVAEGEGERDGVGGRSEQEEGDLQASCPLRPPPPPPPSASAMDLLY